MRDLRTGSTGNREVRGQRATPPQVPARSVPRKSYEPSFPALDPSTFGTLRRLLDETVLADTYREFLRQTRRRLEAALNAPAEQDVAHVLGHTLRGTAGMLGAAGLARVAAEFEAESLPETRFRALVQETLRGCTLLEAALREAHVAL
ncbi:Hpt domain-containing protein [Acidipila sp. EB88]|uniref:Hpt domain-containing protein n=1 Tax=Acidipila sp. EB88 TaxID=2305226 RepID=UPI00131576B3|nr:Hpt domain-containing protein [Acidipila sp. EB88]